jgi:predicted ATP-dependent serine protease
MAVATSDARTIVCSHCGVPYPAQYGGCPRCVKRDTWAWRVAAAAAIVMLALYAIARLSGLVAVAAMRL